jgi:hypothetical protein
MSSRLPHSVGVASLIRNTGAAARSWNARRRVSSSVYAGSSLLLDARHTKLRDRAASDEAKQYWSDRLDALGSLLERVSGFRG